MDKTHTCSQEEQVPQATQSRKRQIESDGDDEPLIKRARLTRKNLALFGKMGKKKKPSAPRESTDGSSTTTTSTTTSGFADKAYKNNIRHPLHSKPPTNVENIRERHARSRATASPPEPEYKRYANNVGKAGNEATMVFQVGGHMLKQYDDDGYNQSFNRAFTGFPKDVGFNNGLSAPQPDYVEGLEKQEYDPFPVDEHVQGAVLYRDDPFSLTLPHMAGEWKGRGRDMDEARLQSAYDGAALVYARNQALAYLGKPDPPGHAEVTTFTTDGTNLNFYAHYAVPEEEDNSTIEYHQYQYATANVRDTHQGHKDGYKGVRNQQDHARKQSYALKDRLKGHWKQHRGDLRPITEGAPLEPPVATNAYEEATTYEEEAGYEVMEQPYQPATSRPRKATNPVPSPQSLPPANDYAHSNSSQKRKAPPSQESSSGSSRHSSKYRSYWKKDPQTGQYYHKHSDGTVSWVDDDDDGRH